MLNNKKKIIFPALLIFFSTIAINFVISGQANAETVANPIMPNSFGELFQQAMRYVQGIAGTVAVVFIIVGGIMYMISAGSKEMAERAKKTLTYAFVGIALVIAAPYFLSDMMLILNGGGGSGSKLLMVATNVLRFLLSIVGILGIIGIVLGAIWMLTAAGDEARYKQGKQAVTYSIIGIAIAAASLVIVQQVMSLVAG